MPAFHKALSNLFNFMRRPIPFMHSLWQKNGDLFSLYLGHKKFHFVYHPKIAAEFLCHRAENYQKSCLIFDKIEPITGKQGLVQLEGDKWQHMRKLTNILFHKQSLAETISIFDKNVKW
jgi:cytochrome P450